MTARVFRAAAPAGIATTVAGALAVSALILFGDFAAAPRFWGLLVLFGLGVLSVWQLARSESLTLERVDQWVWAVLISHTVLTARVRDPRVLAEEGTLSVEIMIEITIWCLCLLYACGRLGRHLDQLRALWGPSTRYALLFFLAAVGSAWYAASTMITLAWTLKLLTILAVSCVLIGPPGKSGSSERFLAATYTGLTLMLTQYLLLGLMSPEAAIEQSQVTGVRRVGGYLLPATQLSAIAGMAAVLALIDILSKRKTRLTSFVFVGSLGLMAASLGRGGMLGAAVAFILVLAAFKRVRLAVVAGLIVVVLFVAAPGLRQLSWELLTRRQDQYQMQSLTGRVPLWEKAVELITMKPFFGWGYVSGSRVAFLSAFKGWPAVHTHNAFLEVLVTLGMTGGAILLAMLWKTCMG
ncbi:MAG TPA: O-antigen ligase family protein, partial [Candidatus Polarisedimenticolia bacterium]|nr:O-antigen ligase family protein [Candidatus Polarisedimenticolia bacterium]